MQITVAHFFSLTFTHTQTHTRRRAHRHSHAHKYRPRFHEIFAKAIDCSLNGLCVFSSFHFSYSSEEDETWESHIIHMKSVYHIHPQFLKWYVRGCAHSNGFIVPGALSHKYRLLAPNRFTIFALMVINGRD